MSFLFSRYVLTMRLPCLCTLNSVLGASRKHSRVNLGITGVWKLFSFQMRRRPLSTFVQIFEHVKLSLCSSNLPLDSLHLAAARLPIGGKVQKWSKASGARPRLQQQSHCCREKPQTMPKHLKGSPERERKSLQHTSFGYPCAGQ